MTKENGRSTKKHQTQAERIAEIEAKPEAFRTDREKKELELFEIKNKIAAMRDERSHLPKGRNATAEEKTRFDSLTDEIANAQMKRNEILITINNLKLDARITATRERVNKKRHDDIIKLLEFNNIRQYTQLKEVLYKAQFYDYLFYLLSVKHGIETEAELLKQFALEDIVADDTSMPLEGEEPENNTNDSEDA